MELTNEFEVDRPIDEAWKVLTDIERIAPCMPGAQLEEVEGDEYRGLVKVKVGPITAQYKGRATFVEKDDSAHKAVIKADGRDSRGQGNASALITAQLTSTGEGRTKVNVNTDLTVTGKVAQFGRGVMADVSEKLLNQFVDCLSTKVLAGSIAADNGAAVAAPVETAPAEMAPAEAAPRSSAEGVRKITPVEPVAPVDLMDAAGASVAKRAAPLVAVLALVLLVLRGRRRRRRRARR
ncbi:MAG: SRPBCC family protein [Acidimicrobiales bacterium]